MHRVASLCFAILLLTAGCTGIDSTPPNPTPTPTADDSVTPTLRSPGATPTPIAAGGATASAIPASGSPASRTVTVTHVVDGDNLDIRYPNASLDTVRLLGVDTPEVHTGTSPEEWEGVPDSDAGHECLRTHGDEASDDVTQWLSGESVRLAFDENEGRLGYNGRLLAYVYHDGEHVNYQLVADGYGRVYDSSFTKRERFYDGEATAQSRELGALSCRTDGGSTPMTSAGSGSGGSGALGVATVHADTGGNEHEKKNDEYVIFENSEDEPSTHPG